MSASPRTTRLDAPAVGQRRRGMSVPYWLLAFVFEATASVVALGLLRLDGLLQTFIALIFHLAAALVITEGWKHRWDSDTPGDRNWALLGFTMTLALFVVGLLGFAALYWLAGRSPRKAALLEEFERFTTVEMDPVDPGASAEDVRNQVDRDLQVSSLRDVLKAGDASQKRGALRSLRKLEPAMAVKLLREALRDPDRHIRYLAASELNKLDRSYTQSILALQRHLAPWIAASSAVDGARTEPPKPEDAAAMHRLTRMYLDYVQSDLPDPSTRRYFVQQGIAVLARLMELTPVERSHSLLRARLLSLADESERARTELEAYLSAAPDDAEAIVLLAQVAYRAGDYARTVRLLQGLDRDALTEPWMQRVLDFWSSGTKRFEGDAA